MIRNNFKLIALVISSASLTFFESCVSQQSFSDQIFQTLTVPEEGGISLQQLTKESDVVTGPNVVLNSTTELVNNKFVTQDNIRWFTASYLSISPDGKNFSFLANNSNSQNIFIRSTEGGSSAIQKTFRSTVSDFAYSKDGSSIAFTDYDGSDYNIYSTDTKKGQAIRQVVATTAPEMNPCFSSDSKRIFFTKEVGGAYSIWAVDLNTSLITQYVEGSNPDFVPGTNEILITRPFKNSNRTAIWKFDYENGTETQLISDQRKSFASAKCSPNGKYIVCTGSTLRTTARPTNLDIYLFKIDGTDEIQLTFHPGTDASAVWAPDSKSIYFLSTRGNTKKEYNVWKMNVEGFFK